MHAQGPPPGVGSGSGGSSTVSSSTSTYVSPDSSLLTYHLAQRPELTFLVAPEALDRSFYMVDPARARTVDYGTLGNLGSSARPLFYETNWRQGFSITPHPFEVYALKPNDLRYIWSKGAYSNVQYALGRGQSEGTFSGQYGRTFADSINFSLDYRGINHAGQFQYQRVKHNAISMGLWLPKKKRWQGFVQFTQNVFRQQENGGIADSISFLDPDLLAGTVGVPINLNDRGALSRLGDWTLQGIHHYDLIGKPNGRKLSLMHEIAWAKQRFHFFDTKENQKDSLFLGSDFYVDSRGIRNYWKTGKLENKFTLRTFKVRTDGGNDLLSVGLEHGFWNVLHDTEKRNFNQLFLVGNIALQLKQTLSLQARAALKVDDTGEFNAEGKLIWNLGTLGIVEASLLQQLVQPYGIQNDLILSGRTVWSNGFQNLSETKFGGSYALPRIGFKATVQNQLIKNFIYFDADAKPKQIGEVVNVSQLLIQENFRLGVFGMEHTLALQATNKSDVLRLPTWHYRGGIFVENNAFKKRVLMRTGAECRANEMYSADNYQPVTWNFFIQNAGELPTYAWLDLYLALKIKNFRFFVRYENLGSAIWTNKFYFLTKNYPQATNQFRMSIAWRFRDQ